MSTNVPAGPGNDPRPSDQHFHHAPDQTELQRYLSLALKKVEPYTIQILVGVVAITVLAVGLIIWGRMEEAGRAGGWQRFVVARVPEDFLALAEEHRETPVGDWARLEAGRGFLQDGLNLAMTDRSASDERLGQARDAFDQLFQRTNRIPREVREGALYGMATALEALSDDDTQQAIDAYEQLMQEFPDSRHYAWAEERARILRSRSAQEFYAWFRRQQPRPVDRAAPRDVQPPGMPFDLDLPLDPDTDPPLFPPEERDDSPPPAGDAPAGDAPAGDAPAENPDAAANTPGRPPSPARPQLVGNKEAIESAPRPVPADEPPQDRQ